MKASLYLEIALFCIASANADTNTVYYTEAGFGTVLVSNLNSGVIYGVSNTLQALPNAPGVLRNNGFGLYWGPMPTATIVAGLTNYPSGVDATLGGSFADVVFGGALLSTPTLAAGTYLLTVTAQYSQTKGTGKQPHLKLVSAGVDVPRSERWAGPEPSNGDWPISIQTTVTLTASGQIKIQGYTTVGTGSITLRSGGSTISWLKIN